MSRPTQLKTPDKLNNCSAAVPSTYIHASVVVRSYVQVSIVTLC